MTKKRLCARLSLVPSSTLVLHNPSWYGVLLLQERCDFERHNLTFSCFTSGNGGAQVLSSLMVYVQKNSSKLNQAHRIILLGLLVRVLEATREKVCAANRELGLNLVEFATREMVATKEDQPDWQQPVSTVLVLLSQHFCNDVIESLLRCFKPGEMPHYFIVKTMADIAAAQGLSLSSSLPSP
jgi:hypothetical protein